MAVAIWDDDYDGSEVSQDGTFDNAIIFKVPAAGGTYEKQVWLRHRELQGENSESSYGVVVDPTDDTGSDESTQLQIAPDVAGSPGTYGSAGASHSFGDVLVGQIIPFWVKATVPSSPVGERQDVYLKLTATSTPVDQKVNLTTGFFTRCAYNPATRGIEFDTADGTGEWQSEWIDITAKPNITEITSALIGQYIYVEYRTSDDTTDATSTAWFTEISDGDFTKDFMQFRARFVASAYQQGLVCRTYSGLEFNTYISTANGVNPYNNTIVGPGPPVSAKLSGYFQAGVAGVYGFAIDSVRGHRLFIDGAMLFQQWDDLSVAGTVSDQGSISLTAGWHSILIDFHSGNPFADRRLFTYVSPPSMAQRAVTYTDFSVDARVLRLSDLKFKYSGPHDYHFDCRLIDGPDVPRPIAPPNGYQTRFFSPELTVFQHNCDTVEFQMDFDRSFASPYLVQWTEPCVAESNVLSKAPNGPRPPGVWYWRARGILGSDVSNWCDWQFLTILPLVPHDEFIYLNVNVGFAPHDSIVDDRFLYLNDNVGVAIHDPIVDGRFLYLNVDIELGIGEIIYPMYDNTRARKLVFDGDQAFYDSF